MLSLDSASRSQLSGTYTVHASTESRAIDRQVDTQARQWLLMP